MGFIRRLPFKSIANTLQISENARLKSQLAALENSGNLTEEERMELLRLRGEVGMLRNQARLEASQHPPTTPEGRNGKTALEVWKPEDFSNSGYATPEVAVLTVLWAMSNNHLDELVGSVALNADATEEDMESIRAALDREAQWGPQMINQLEEIRLISMTNVTANVGDPGQLEIQIEMVMKNGDLDSERLTLVEHNNEWKWYYPMRSHIPPMPGTHPPPAPSPDPATH